MSTDPPRELPAGARTAEIDEVYRRLKLYHGIETHVARDRLHELKKHEGRGPADDLLFDLTGNVYDPASREWLGCLTEGGKE